MIVITGATGKLGARVIEGLIQKLPATQIAAAVRNPEKAAGMAALGVQVRLADYSKPETLRVAFGQAEKLLLISSSELGQRVAQHRAVIEAAKTAGVGLLAYTSVLRADTSSLSLAVDHKATEEAIRASGLKHVILRNGWYFENHTEQLATVLQHGIILGAAGAGRISAASRADFAAAAVTVLTSAGHINQTYELAGDSSFTLSELAGVVSRLSGKQVPYKNLSPEDYRAALLSAGLPSAAADLFVDCDLGAAKGELDSSSRDLHNLIGRPTTTLDEAVSAALGVL